MASDSLAENGVQQELQVVNNCDIGGLNNDGPSSYGPPSPLTGCYLLIVLGEPHSLEHKDIILQRLLKGLLSWNVLDCHVDLEEELRTLTQHAPDGEVARHGERLIQYASENLVTEILIHPQYNTLIQCMRNMLSSFTKHRHIIHSGYTFSGNGSWILQDGTFSVSDFSEAFQDHDVQRVLRAYPDTISMEINCAAAGLWTALPDKPYAKSCKIRINSVDILDSGSDKLNGFIDYLAPMLIPASLNDLLESSDVVGNIRFSHPTLYVFPAGQGDAALFGINGFNMLVDGGFNRKSCFWDFARHLDRLDAVLMTRINNSNIQGINSIIERKKSAHVYPQIGHFFTNVPERKSLNAADADKDKDPLMVNLFERGQQLTSNLKSINLQPQTCYKEIEPINLYHKVGHGTLDMYVISPSRDSKPVKEFLQKWNACDHNLFAAKDTKEFQFPLQNLVSICAMLIWQPANPDETITRILFPGSTPDYKIIEGLEKMKHLEFMKHPVCTANKLATSISSNILSKKLIKSVPIEKSTIAEPILPSKTTKHAAAIPEKDNKNVDSKQIKSIPATDNKIVSDAKAATKSAAVTAAADKDKENKIVSETKSKIVDNKTASETVKSLVKSRIDSKPPKSIEKRIKKESSTEKKELGKASPVTTPKKTATEPKVTNGFAKENGTKSKVLATRKMKSSPSSTPAKSTKEANNRKVLESKQTATRTVKREVVTATTTTEKKEIKMERKPISRRSMMATGSPVKSLKPKSEKDNIIRKAKLDKAAASDSSVVSTPSADDAKAKDAIDPEQQDKQILLDDLKEEEEAVKEIEAVFKRSEERSKQIETDVEKRTVVIEKQDSATEADEDDEYIIIEKEEIEHTEDSVNEPESSVTKEEEMQKHQRDSQESEKKRKPSAEGTEGDNDDEKVRDESGPTEEIEAAEDEKPKSPTDADVKEKPHHPAPDTINVPKEHEERENLAEELSPSPEDKLSSATKKTTDTKDEGEPDQLQPDLKEGDVVNKPESQPFSGTIESGATTAPTLPEDEHMPLDEIKEDIVIEEKYIKEETKEIQVVTTTEAKAVAATVSPTAAPAEPRAPLKNMQFDSKQAHLRDVVKTPDEVADLPVHEVVDSAVQDDIPPTIEEEPTGEASDEIEAAPKEGEEELLKTKTDEKANEKEGIMETSNETEKEDELQDKIDVVLDDKSSLLKQNEPNDISPIATVPAAKQAETARAKETPSPLSPVESKDGKSSISPTSGRKIDDKLTEIKEKIDVTAEKVEYMIEELGKGFENTLKDVTNRGKSPDAAKKIPSKAASPETPSAAAKPLTDDEPVPRTSAMALDVGEKETTEEEVEGDEKVDGTKVVYDYSHPFAAGNELRETHITTLDSPVNEKSKLIDLQVIDKYMFDDSNLNDIKEEEDEDRLSPPADAPTTIPLTVHAEVPRAVSPREEEVLKIVVNVAEVLKSEKDITDIIPDFSEEELEKKLQRASPKQFDDEGATVQRMLVTASSEDGGEEIEICAEGTIKFSPISSTPDVQSGKATPDGTGEHEFSRFISEEKTVLSSVSIDTKESRTSTPEAKTSPTSVDEKEQHELPEKSPSDKQYFPIVTDTNKVRSHFTLTEAPRKESTISEMVANMDDSRRESAISTLSERDFTKEESSIEDRFSRPETPVELQHDTEVEIDAETTMASVNATMLEEAVLVESHSSEVKAVVPIDQTLDVDKQSTSRRESATSRVSERPDSVISHFSDRTEPELKDPMDPFEKSPTHANNLEKSMISAVEAEDKPDSHPHSRDEKPAAEGSPANQVYAEKDLKKDVDASSRLESVGSHVSDVKEIDLKDIDSRPTSTTSHEEAVETKEEKDSSAGKNSRPPSSADVEKPLVTGAGSRPASVASDAKETEPKDKDSRPASTASHKEEIETKEEKDSRAPSASSQTSDKDLTEIKGKESRAPSIASALSDTRETEPKDKDSRPASTVSHKEEIETKEEKDSSAGKDSRPPSSADAGSRPASVASDAKETEPKDKDSRPASTASHKEEIETKEEKDSSAGKDSRPPSSADVEKPLITGAGSRPASVASQLSDSVSVSHNDSAIETKVRSDANGKLESHTDSAPKKKDTADDITNTQILAGIASRSISSITSEEVVVEKGVRASRPAPVASHMSDAREEEEENVSRVPSAGSHVSNEKSGTEVTSRPDSVASLVVVEISQDGKLQSDAPSSGAKAESESESKKKDVADDITNTQILAGSASRSISSITAEEVVVEKVVSSSRPESVASNVSDKSFEGGKLAEKTGQQTTEESKAQEPEPPAEQSEHPSVKGARSYSVASIMVSSIYKPDEFDTSGLTKIVEHSKDDTDVTGIAQKATDISALIDEAKKIDSKLTSTKNESIPLSTEEHAKLAEQVAHDLSGKSSPHTQTTSSLDSKSIPSSHDSGETESPKPSSPFPKDAIQSTVITATTTMVSSSMPEKSEVVVEKSTIFAEDASGAAVTSSQIDTTPFGGIHTLQTIRDLPSSGEFISKEISTIKSELRNYTAGSDDYETQNVYSPRSDISSGQASRVLTDSHPGSDEEMPISPFSGPSKVDSSPQRFSYDEYELQRSGSVVSKKSDLDIDDSQNDIPPQYGSKEVESAISITSTYKATADPMSTSFYGELPSAFGKSEPIAIHTVRTVVTKQYDDYHSSGADESSSYASQESYHTKPSDHKFLDEADLDFEKALEEHRQVRGSEVMSSVTSKYEFSPTKNAAEQQQMVGAAAKDFPLDDVKQSAKEQIASSATAIAQQVEENLKKAEERVASWGKPLGLPSPAPISDSQTTPKKERKLVVSKTKLNNEKNLRKRSESPIKSGAKNATPIYMDLTYVPHNGNSYYSHVEFFKRIRARYYVFSGTEPSRDVYNALLEAKQTWEDKDLEVTIIPTYDTDVLGYWVSDNEELLAKYHIDLSPSASRCTINLQDHETSCSAYRLEF